LHPRILADAGRFSIVLVNQNQHDNLQPNCSPKMNALTLSSIVVVGLGFVSGVIFIGIASVDYVYRRSNIYYGNDDYLYLYTNPYAYVAAGLFLCSFTLACTIAAYPLAFAGSKKYNGDTSTGKPYMIVSWVLYGFTIFLGANIIGIGGACRCSLYPGINVAYVLLGPFGWLLMFRYSEMARRSSQVHSRPKFSPQGGTESTDVESPSENTDFPSGVTETVSSRGSKTVTHTTAYPDGSKIIQVTEVVPAPKLTSQQFPKVSVAESVNPDGSRTIVSTRQRFIEY